MGALRPTEFFRSPGTETLHKVGAGEQDMESVHVLGYTTVCDLGISELPLDN